MHRHCTAYLLILLQTTNAPREREGVRDAGGKSAYRRKSFATVCGTAGEELTKILNTAVGFLSYHYHFRHRYCRPRIKCCILKSISGIMHQDQVYSLHPQRASWSYPSVESGAVLWLRRCLRKCLDLPARILKLSYLRQLEYRCVRGEVWYFPETVTMKNLENWPVIDVPIWGHNYACVGWQVTLFDSIWQVTSRICEMEFH